MDVAGVDILVIGSRTLANLRVCTWLHAVSAVFALCLTAACAQSPGPAASGRTPEHGTASDFVGRWAYVQSCGWQHSAELELVAKGDDAKGDDIRGTWNDGTRAAGDDGELRGTLRDGRLYLAFCSSGSQAGGSVCPQFGAQDGYLLREGKTVGWYRDQGGASTRYLTLHRVVEGVEIPVDDQCPDDATTP
jgi:hypothetical protein